jgi:hypothetical protein
MAPLLIPIAMQLAQYAPSIIKLLTGSDKAAEVAGAVVGVAQAVTGTSSPQEALAAIQADPQKVLDFQQAMAAQQIDLEKAYLADRQDARDRDVGLAKLGRRIARADIMVALDVVGLIACLLVLCFFRSAIPPEAVGLISTIAATFGLCLRDAHQFEFGSSRSSQAKDSTINNLTK